MKKVDKRGSGKIKKAFAMLPSEPIPFDQYCKVTGVSPNTLRQCGRFDTTGLLGQVRLITVKGVRCIYREKLSVALAAITKPEDILP